MNTVLSTILNLLPGQKKTTPSGWISFNAFCCHHRGEKLDKRSRGGILVNNDGFQYHCFNCDFKAGWTPGKLLSSNTKKLFLWAGLPDSEITKLGLYTLKIKDDQPILLPKFSSDLIDKSLPEESRSVNDWIKDPEINPDLLAIIDYVVYQRGMNLDWYPWYWSPSNGYKDRVIIPFFHEDRIVGWTGRKITSGNPKYLTDSQPGYVFNLDSQKNKKFVIIVEGQFDAIGIDACAIMTNEPNESQIRRIKNLDSEIIVVPDRDRAGSKIIKYALENDWAISCPDWGPNVKDVADAVKIYGRVYTLFTILHYRETNKIKIQLLQKKLENINA